MVHARPSHPKKPIHCRCQKWYAPAAANAQKHVAAITPAWYLWAPNNAHAINTAAPATTTSAMPHPKAVLRRKGYLTAGARRDNRFMGLHQKANADAKGIATAFHSEKSPHQRLKRIGDWIPRAPRGKKGQ